MVEENGAMKPTFKPNPLRAAFRIPRSGEPLEAIAKLHPKTRWTLALVLLGKMLYLVHPLIAVGAWLFWLLVLWRERHRLPEVFWPSLWAGLFSLAGLVALGVGLGKGVDPETLVSQDNVLELALAYLLGFPAAYFYSRALVPFLGRWAYLWLAGTVLFPVGFFLHFGVRLALIYHLLRSIRRDQEEGGHKAGAQAEEEPEGVQLAQVPHQEPSPHKDQA
jgi:hypothetical protein